MTECFDFVYQERQIVSPIDAERGFYYWDVETLDAPDFLPAGSTQARTEFHVTSFTYRGA